MDDTNHFESDGEFCSGALQARRRLGKGAREIKAIKTVA